MSHWQFLKYFYLWIRKGHTLKVLECYDRNQYSEGQAMHKTFFQSFIYWFKPYKYTHGIHKILIPYVSPSKSQRNPQTKNIQINFQMYYES